MGSNVLYVTFLSWLFRYVIQNFEDSSKLLVHRYHGFWCRGYGISQCKYNVLRKCLKYSKPNTWPKNKTHCSRLWYSIGKLCTGIDDCSCVCTRMHARTRLFFLQNTLRRLSLYLFTECLYCDKVTQYMPYINTCTSREIHKKLKN
jgi:hypothetical protein